MEVVRRSKPLPRMNLWAGLGYWAAIREYPVVYQIKAKMTDVVLFVVFAGVATAKDVVGSPNWG